MSSDPIMTTHVRNNNYKYLSSPKDSCSFSSEDKAALKNHKLENSASNAVSPISNWRISNIFYNFQKVFNASTRIFSVFFNQTTNARCPPSRWERWVPLTYFQRIKFELTLFYDTCESIWLKEEKYFNLKFCKGKKEPLLKIIVQQFNGGRPPMKAWLPLILNKYPTWWTPLNWRTSWAI